MFQTEPILFLQALASGWLTWAMARITSMGYAPFYVAVIGVGLLAGLGLPGSGTAIARVASGMSPAHYLLWGTVTIGPLLGLYHAG